jgi:CRISPR/Cas system CMR subunit Cmr6 (Cas7 group RAMP superfamily)
MHHATYWVSLETIQDKMVTKRNSARPWFNSELRREIRKRDRIRKIAKTFTKQSDIDKYKKQRNKVNNLKKTAKEHFEQNLDTLINVFAILRIRSRFLISLLSSLLNHGLALLRLVTILVGMHSYTTN